MRNEEGEKAKEIILMLGNEHQGRVKRFMWLINGYALKNGVKERATSQMINNWKHCGIPDFWKLLLLKEEQNIYKEIYN